jgi:hypothetical protein
MKYYTFTIRITGYGKTKEQAWLDATVDNTPISLDDVIEVEEGETEVEEDEEAEDTTDCQHFHLVIADPYASSRTGPGCLRTGGHCRGRCRFYSVD